MSGYTEIALLQYELEKLRARIAEKDEVIAEAGEMLAMRDRQLAALKAELREICDAINDPAGDLTLTAVECIKKLKAENESLKRDAERKTNGNRKIRDLVDGLLAQAGYAPDSSARHNLSLMNFDAAMKGEQ